MANDRVLFIPWNRNQAGTFAGEHTEAQRQGSHHKRNWQVVCLDDPGQPLRALGFGSGWRVHVVGHGAIGDPTIDPDHGINADPVHADDLADMLMAKGLRKHYLGTIACDVCHSALGDPCFAKVLARALWDRGFRATCVLGYKGSLFSTYRDRNANSRETNTLTGKTHKYKHRVVEDAQGNIDKSKNLQERFFGWT